MRIALIAEQFPPLRTSCAVQVRDLAETLSELGHAVTVLTPSEMKGKAWELEDWQGVRVLRLRTFPTRDRAYVVRVLGEFAMPFLMAWALARSPLADDAYDGIVWYSPSIFFGPLVGAIKRRWRIPTYLILRDIFPEWAADLGIMRRGFAFRLLRAVARFQYQAADIIGVQTPGNVEFFAADISAGKSVEVLQNWMKEPEVGGPVLEAELARLSGRRIFVYAGNMGVAQGMDKLLSLATALREDRSAGFLFVGRGSEVTRMRAQAEERQLDNCVFADEIDSRDIPALYARCDFGLVALDARHRWHNIPGKFISYMHAGLPVLASVNSGNDIVTLIENFDVGKSSIDDEGADLPELARALLNDEAPAEAARQRCRDLGHELFGARTAAEQVVAGLRRCA